ncbi:MAG: YgiT-type zinc finger protein [Chloroflexi bacterium]|nr:YgiT-type zinc finger protein [Chloroflexota bacterium]
MSVQTNPQAVPCPRCENPMRSGLVKTTMVIRDQLYMVEDVQAMICDECVEQFYDEDTTDALRRLTQDGFPPAEVVREILVPVYSLKPRMQRYTGIQVEEQPEFAQADAQG